MKISAECELAMGYLQFPGIVGLLIEPKKCWFNF